MASLPSPVAARITPEPIVTRCTSLRAAALLAWLFALVIPAAAADTAADDHVFNVRQYGATGKRADRATQPLQQAIDACTAAGGGTVYVPPGDYTTGALHLKDNVNLHLEAGATLFLSQDKSEFPQRARSMINAQGARNIAVTGRGTLDGLAQYEFADTRDDDPEVTEALQIAKQAGIPGKRYYRIGMQTFMFVLNHSTDVRLEGITVINSPLWNVLLDHCDRVFIRGVHIYSDLEKGVNADGIDIVCSRNVMISDSIIVTGDDAIALKTESRAGEPGPVENVTVTNCILTSSSTAFTIGTETHADVRHVILSNCVIRDSNKGFGIQVEDGATVSDVLFTNLTIDTRRRHWNWWGSAETFRFVLKQRTPESKLGAIRNIVVDNVVSHARGTSTIVTPAGRPLENITFANLQIHMQPEDARDKRATDALQIDGVKDLTLRNVTVRWADDGTEPKWSSAVHLKNVTGLEIDNFRGRQGLKGSPAPTLVLENVTDALIRDSRAAADAGTFLDVRGSGSSGITLRNNDLSRAATPVTLTSGAPPGAITER